MDNKYSLFIGRFQPFHKGHEALIMSELIKNHKVCIAIRDTGIDDKNPFSFDERYDMIREIFPDTENVLIIKIPDIRGVYYGRNVGYDVEQIRVDPKLEEISGTKIRKDIYDNLDKWE